MPDKAILPEKLQQMNLLFDFYGDLLTQKQNDYFTMYYLDDFSLAEIAKIYQVTPQAAADNLKRTCAILINYEEKLGLIKKHDVLNEKISNIVQLLDDISNEPKAVIIKAMVMELND